MKNVSSKEIKNRETPLADALDSFNATVSGLGSSYLELKKRIEELNVQISEKNKYLEKNFFEVNRLRWFFDSILNSMTDGVVVIDIVGNVVLFNEGIEKLSGYRSEEVLGKLYIEVFGKHTSKRFSPLYTLSQGVSLLMEEKEIQTKSGHMIPVRYSTSLVIDNQERTLGVVEVISDLTRIKRLEKEMLHIKTQAALNQMAGLVAHEIRNPLGGIRGYVDLISESLEKEDSRHEMVKQINQAINRLDEIVANFMLFARPVKPNFESMDLKQFIQDVKSFFYKSHALDEKNIHIDLKFPDVPIHARIDPLLLEQSLLVVMDNGVKAMPSGGVLRVELRQEVQKEKDLKGRIYIIVTDSGKGMDQNVLKKLFTPFFTTREKGMGLGLALARNFISLHQGNIYVDSEVGMGCTVTIELPII